MSEDPLTTEMVLRRIHPRHRIEGTSALLLPFAKAGPAAPLAQPHCLADVLAAQLLDHKRLCRTFSDCTTVPRHGLVSGCYLLDSSYRDRDERERLAAIKARRKEVP
jgi:hypothetical protein